MVPEKMEGGIGMAGRQSRLARDYGNGGLAAAAPSCETCTRYRTCDRAEEGTFCTQWQGREARERGESPADAWSRGEDSL